MGYPIRANIFNRRNSYEREQFAKFPIQVTVLFSSAHQEFYEGFRDIFAKLDLLTDVERLG